MVQSVCIELYLVRGFYNWRRGWFPGCKEYFLAKMNFRDLEIGGIRPFDVNSDPSSVGTEWKRWLRSFQLYADGKGLIIVPDKDDNKVQRRALLLHCAGSVDQDIFFMFCQTLVVQRITRRLKMP